MQAVQLRLREELEVVGRLALLRLGLAAPWQRIPLWIASCEQVHQPPHDTRKRPAPFASVRAQSAERPRSDATETRAQSPLDQFPILPMAHRLNLSHHKPAHP